MNKIILIDGELSKNIFRTIFFFESFKNVSCSLNNFELFFIICWEYFLLELYEIKKKFLFLIYVIKRLENDKI